VNGAAEKANEPNGQRHDHGNDHGMLAARRQAPGLAADITDLFRTLAKALFDPYRPELHYMRGPGPKWHAKHDPVCAPKAVAAMPAMIRCA
jgi:hypothetical protein